MSLAGMIAGLEDLQRAMAEMSGGEDHEPEPINRMNLGHIAVVVDQISSFIGCMQLPRLSAEQWSMLLALHLMATTHRMSMLMEPDGPALEINALRDAYRDIEARLIIAIVWLRLLEKPHEIRFCTPATLILDAPEEYLARTA